GLPVATPQPAKSFARHREIVAASRYVIGSRRIPVGILYTLGIACGPHPIPNHKKTAPKGAAIDPRVSDFFTWPCGDAGRANPNRAAPSREASATPVPARRRRDRWLKLRASYWPNCTTNHR